MSTVLVIDRNYMGDVLLSSPVYRHLKEGMGESPDVWTLPNSAQVLRHIGDVGRVWTEYDWRAMRDQRYQIALHLNTSFKTNLMIAALGIPFRIGYDYRWRGLINNVAFEYPFRTLRGAYRSEECVSLLERAFEWKNLSRCVHLPKVRMDIGAHLLYELENLHFPVVALHVNCANHHKYRRWSADKFKTLAQMLIENGCSVLFTGSMSDYDYIEDIRKTLPVGSVNVCMQSLYDTAVVLQMVDVMVSINTFMLHFAIHSRVPTVGIIGRTPARYLWPFQTEHVVMLEDPALKDYDPLKIREIEPRLEEIAPREVYDAAMKLLKRRVLEHKDDGSGANRLCRVETARRKSKHRSRK